MREIHLTLKHFSFFFLYKKSSLGLYPCEVDQLLAA